MPVLQHYQHLLLEEQRNILLFSLLDSYNIAVTSWYDKSFYHDDRRNNLKIQCTLETAIGSPVGEPILKNSASLLFKKRFMERREVDQDALANPINGCDFA
ncbi:hypothetical protein [Methylobacterium sp. Leaf99]|uniref:hypothetical protein n=1 Tax=Methylobacterium sp. Leaf99 TaxID=1736251 RepID=UPI0012EE45BC|nr:hypothetical protein [Methylobacterium sp. Leaf99]